MFCYIFCPWSYSEEVVNNFKWKGKSMNDFKKNIESFKQTLQYLEDNYKELEFEEEVNEQFYEGIHRSKMFCDFLECLISDAEK